MTRYVTLKQLKRAGQPEEMIRFTPKPPLHSNPMEACERCHWVLCHYNLVYHVRIRQELGV